MKTVLVGCGKVGHIHAAALVSLKESQFVGVCDADAGRAAAFAAQYGTQPFTDVRAMVSATGAEAVMVCTPHPQHALNTVDAVECGAHVLIEKPMAASLEDCDRMLAAARDARKTLGIVSQRRFYEPVMRMKQAIAEGRIGRPALGMMTMLSWRDEAYYRSDPWRGTWAGEGGGVLVNQSPHQLDILRWLMGEVEEVTGYWANVNHPSIEVEDTAVAALRFRGGGLASIVTSVSQRPGIYTKVHVHGSSGASVGVQTDGGSTFIAGMSGIQEPPVNDLWTIPGEEGKLAEWQAEDRARFASMDPIAHYHGLQIRDFLQALEEGRSPLVTGEEGRAVTEIFRAIYRAQETGRPVRLPL